MNCRIISLLFVVIFSGVVHSQVTLSYNLLTDLELSKAGDKSHYYYNEIDQDRTAPRLGLTNVNLISKLKFGKQWALQTRVLLERDKGKKLNRWALPVMNLQWVSKKRKFGVTLGSFVNPFGSFNKKQLSTSRSFVGLPLCYAYYINISDKIGFVENLGDISKVKVDNEVQWGSSILYYGGYTTGALFSWNIKPGKINWKIALTTGASNMQNPSSRPLHYGLVSHLKLRPKYYWEQGFSISHGSFLIGSEEIDHGNNLNGFTQTIVGTDYKFGHKYFELSGEIVVALYNISEYQIMDTIIGLKNLDLNCFSTYFDLKYEPPFLQGSYLAYRIDYLDFGTFRNDDKWDNLVVRHSFAVGYHIHKNVLARLAISTQHVDSKKWNKGQRTLRLVLTGHL